MPTKSEYGYNLEDLPPELQAQELRLRRQQGINDALLQNTLQPLQAPEVKGRFQGAISPWAALAKIAGAAAGAYRGSRLEDERAGLLKKHGDLVAEEISRIKGLRTGKAGDAVEGWTTEGEQTPVTVTPAVKPDPRAAIETAILSRYKPAQRYGALMLKEQETAENRAARLQERLLTIEARAEDQRLNREQRADLATQAADLRREMAQMSADTRRDIAGAGSNKPQSDIGKLEDDLRAGRITKEQYEKGLEIKSKPLIELGLKQEKEKKATELRAKGAAQRADLVIDKIDKAVSKAGWWETGIPGAITGQIPGFGAYDLRRDIDTIKANIGFGELQAMREASPTGGALGQIAVQELNFLQAAIASLDANQSQENLRSNLDAVRRHYTNWKNAVVQSAGTGTTAPTEGWSITPVK